MESKRSFAFVSGGQSGKPRTRDRKLIRSHCMRGKNKRQTVEVPEVHFLPGSDAMLLSFPVSKRLDDPLILASQPKSKRPRRPVVDNTVDKIIQLPVAVAPSVPPFAGNLDTESLKVLLTGQSFIILGVEW